MIRNVSKEALGNSKENRFRTDSQISERIPKFRIAFPDFGTDSQRLSERIPNISERVGPLFSAPTQARSSP